MAGGLIELTTPMLFSIGFIFLFTLGGVTGVVSAMLVSISYYTILICSWTFSLRIIYGVVFGLFAVFISESIFFLEVNIQKLLVITFLVNSRWC